METVIQLAWERHKSGYEIEKRQVLATPARFPYSMKSTHREPDPDRVIDHIVARVDQDETMPVLIESEGQSNACRAFELFAAADSREKKVAFIDEFGPLFKEEIESGQASVPSFEALRGQVEIALELAEDERWREHLSFFLVTKDGLGRAATALELLPGRERPSFVLKPVSLWDFLVLELASVWTSSDVVRRCPECGRHFIISRAKGMRTHRKHCGDTCKKAAYRQRLAAKAARD